MVDQLLQLIVMLQHEVSVEVGFDDELFGDLVLGVVSHADILD